jgi:hypothetical protein
MLRKTFLIAIPILAFAPSSEAASPAVGDFAEYSITVTSPGSGDQTSTESMSIIGYDQATNQFEVEVTTKEAGSPPVTTTAWRPAHSFLPNPSLDLLGAGCSRGGGTIESIQTPAGAIQACGFHPGKKGSEIRARNATWVGTVPFGLVKLEWVNELDQTRTTKVLTKFGSKK